ncbi:MAG: metal-dependent transcriptional regulator [Opitutales bacterium]|nr:metal-dependent transcriptional regulator [Opitutales bacterium]
MKTEERKLSESKEDYLEAVLVLSKPGGSARSSQIAKKLNIRKASVAQAMRALRDEGYVSFENYSPISLTKKGREVAEGVFEAHRAISAFLTAQLGVEDSLAEETACKMEHAFTPELKRRFVSYINKLSATRA